MKTSKNLDLLRVLADFRLATPPLLASGLGTSEQMVRRRCRQLAGHGFIKVDPRSPGQGRGRPEIVYSLRPAGVQELTRAKLLPADILARSVTSEEVEHIMSHQLTLNWLLISCAAMQTSRKELIVKSISSTSPFHVSASGRTILFDRVGFPNGEEISFIPDAAICLSHKETSRSLLFFLEVDLGTETIADPIKASSRDLRRKIIVYRNYLGRHGYRRYTKTELFNTTLRGFRLLLVAHTEARAEALSRLVNAMQPSDFVWVSDLPMIRRLGFAGNVWTRGGRIEDNRLSILPPFPDTRR